MTDTLRHRGSILILVLFVLTVLSLTAVSFAYRAGLEHRSSGRGVALIRMRSEARSAVALALAGLTTNTNGFDHWAEPWHTHAPFETDTPWARSGLSDTYRVDPIQTRYAVTDEEAKLHVHYASSEALESLGMSPAQIDGLFDWMDADENARPSGAESRYYLGRAPPHRSKNAPMEVLEEMLAIRGISRQQYWGEDENHDRILDEAEDDGPPQPPLDNGDGQLQPGWVDLLTVVGDGRINLNTARRAVLATLPLSDGAADQIVGYRRFDGHSAGRLSEHVFDSDQDIDQLQGLTDADREVLHQIGRFRSEHFRVLVTARDAGQDLTYRLQVLVRVSGDGGPPAVLQWREGR